MSTYHSNAIKKCFAENKIADFKELWDLKTAWFEEPNYGRNGCSGVIKHPFKDETGKDNFIFIKRQENHNHKTLLNPIKGVPTFRREFININRLIKNNIPTLTALYYGERKKNGKKQAILVTRSLENYQSFEEYFADPNNNDQDLRFKIMQQGGVVIRQLHNAHFRHNCLYPKHLFVKVSDNSIDVRLIDLEKLIRLPFLFQVRKKDLSRIIRRSGPLTKAEIIMFVESYMTYTQDLSHSSLQSTLDQIIKKRFNKT